MEGNEKSTIIQQQDLLIGRLENLVNLLITKIPSQSEFNLSICPNCSCNLDPNNTIGNPKDTGLTALNVSQNDKQIRQASELILRRKYKPAYGRLQALKRTTEISVKNITTPKSTHSEADSEEFLGAIPSCKSIDGADTSKDNFLHTLSNITTNNIKRQRRFTNAQAVDLLHIPSSQNYGSLREQNYYKSQDHPQSSTSFLPDGYLKIGIDVIYTLLVLYEYFNILLTSLAGWWDYSPSIGALTTDIMIYIFLAFFIFINFQVAYVDEFLLFDHRDDIRRHYFRRYFLIDLFFSIPLDLFALGWSVRAYRILQLMRLLRVLRVHTLFRQSNPLKQRPAHILFLITIFWVILFFHVIACIWLLLKGDSESQLPKDWNVSELTKNYLRAVYWSGTTLSTVGYGDITPQTLGARMYAFVVMLFGVTVFTSFISRNAALITSGDSFTAHLRQRKSELATLMDVYKVPWSIQKEVIATFPHLLKTTMVADTREAAMKVLPPYLRTKINNCIKMELLSHVVIFQEAGLACLSKLAALLKHRFYPSGVTLFEHGTQADKMYFLSGGIVQVQILDEEIGEMVMHRTFGEGDWFGEIELLLDVPRTCSVNTITPVSIFELSKSDFLVILQQYPQFRQIIYRELSQRIEELASKTLPVEAVSKDVYDLQRVATNAFRNALASAPYHSNIHTSSTVNFHDSPTYTGYVFPPPAAMPIDPNTPPVHGEMSPSHVGSTITPGDLPVTPLVEVVEPPATSRSVSSSSTSSETSHKPDYLVASTQYTPKPYHPSVPSLDLSTSSTLLSPTTRIQNRGAKNLALAAFPAPSPRAPSTPKPTARQTVRNQNLAQAILKYEARDNFMERRETN